MRQLYPSFKKMPEKIFSFYYLKTAVSSSNSTQKTFLPLDKTFLTSND